MMTERSSKVMLFVLLITLIGYGLAFSAESDDSVLKAAESGDYEGLKSLISKGADLNVKDASGDTPLHIASLRNHISIVKLLISNDAKVNVSDDSGDTPLSYAAHRGNAEIVELLLSAGADVNTKDKREITPLMRAERKNHEAVIKLLKSHGAEK